MRLSFDIGTLLLKNAPETVPYAEWDGRVASIEYGHSIAPLFKSR